VVVVVVVCLLDFVASGHSPKGGTGVSRGRGKRQTIREQRKEETGGFKQFGPDGGRADGGGGGGGGGGCCC